MEFRHQLRTQRLLALVQQRFLGQGITVDRKEIDSVLRNARQNSVPVQYHVLDILLESTGELVTKGEMDKITQLAKKMAMRLRSGDNLAEVIKEAEKELKRGSIKSEDLEWRRLDELPGLFAKEVATMKVNQIAGPLSAPNGLHLLKLLEVNKLKAAELTRDQASNMVFHRKLAEKIKPWLKELREHAYIEPVPFPPFWR